MIFFQWIAISLIFGISASLFASFLWWNILFRRKLVDIKFSNGLQIRPSKSTLYNEHEILVKIANLGKHDFVEISIDAKIMIDATNYTYLAVGNSNYVNHLRGQHYIGSKQANPGGFMHILRIHLDDRAFAHFSKKTYSWAPEIIKKAKSKKLTLWDIFKKHPATKYPKKATLQFFLHGYNKTTGIRKTFESKEYTFKDIKPYKFAEDSVDISEKAEDLHSDIENITEYAYCEYLKHLASLKHTPQRRPHASRRIIPTLPGTRDNAESPRLPGRENRPALKGRAYFASARGQGQPQAAALRRGAKPKAALC